MLIVVKKVLASKLGQKNSIVHINDAIRKVTMFLKNELNFVKMSHGAITWRKNIFMKNRPNLIENDTICSVVLSSLIGDRTIWFCCCLTSKIFDFNFNDISRLAILVVSCRPNFWRLEYRLKHNIIKVDLKVFRICYLMNCVTQFESWLGSWAGKTTLINTNICCNFCMIVLIRGLFTNYVTQMRWVGGQQKCYKFKG